MDVCGVLVCGMVCAKTGIVNANPNAAAIPLEMMIFVGFIFALNLLCVTLSMKANSQRVTQSLPVL